MRVSKIAMPMVGLNIVDELVVALAKSTSMDAIQQAALLDRARSAIRDKRLKSRDPETGLRFSSPQGVESPSPLVTVEDFNEWLADEGAPYRVGGAELVAPTDGTVRHSTKSVRRDSITSVIEVAQKKCSDPNDTSQ